MLHEVNQTAKDREKPYDFTFMWNLKNNNKKKSQAEQKQTHREQTGGYQVGRGRGTELKRWKDQEVRIGGYKIVVGYKIEHRGCSQ